MRRQVEFSEYQHQLLSLERERGWERVLPSHTFLHMGEEMGEIGRILQYLEGYRETDLSTGQLHADLAEELADLMAFIFKLASQHDIDMGEAMHTQLAKFVSRNRDIDVGRREMARYVSYQERNLAWIKGGQQ